MTPVNSLTSKTPGFLQDCRLYLLCNSSYS